MLRQEAAFIFHETQVNLTKEISFSEGSRIIFCNAFRVRVSVSAKITCPLRTNHFKGRGIFAVRFTFQEILRIINFLQYENRTAIKVQF